MKTAISSILLLLFTVTVTSQRIVYNGQNVINQYLDDPSYISLNGNYNMTGIIQASDTDISNTSQYVSAQLSPFDNFAFGLDYSRHSYHIYRYSQLFLNTRLRLNLGSEFHYINLGASIGTDRLNEDNSSKENEINTIYRLGLHYTNFNLTLGGYLNTYPIQNSLLNSTLEPLTTYEGYSGYLSYRIRVSDNLRITPTAKYNSYSDLNFFEGIANFNYKGYYELSASYKNDYSIMAVASGRFFKYFRVSYSFENAIGIQNFNNIHSVGISVDLTPKEAEIPEWLANVKRNREKIKSIKKVKEEPVIVEEPAEVIIDEIDEVEIVKTEELTDEEKYPVMNENTPSDIIDNKLKPGYYIILGSFVKTENANKEVERLKQNGFYARSGKKDANDKFNYVYVDRYEDRDIAILRTKKKQQEEGFERVWLLRIK